MLGTKAVTFLLAAGSVQLIDAHTAFTNFFINGADQGDGVAVRMSNNLPQATFPLPSVTSPDMACGRFEITTEFSSFTDVFDRSQRGDRCIPYCKH